jgi:hypothetical protein
VTVIDKEPHLHFEIRVVGMKTSSETALVVRAGRGSTVGGKMAHLFRSSGMVIPGLLLRVPRSGTLASGVYDENALRIESLFIL